VHPAGYDVWRDREAFLARARTGAPPDLFNPRGQDWGTPPLHPEGIRTGGYAYQIACIRHLMAHSGVLRIDHIMGLHRIWVLPPGHDARDGVYVRYRGEENYAILCLESLRARAMVLGEDLGTVPGYVRAAMGAHRVHRSYVAMFEVTPDGLAPPPPDAFASVNTHDMAPFASFWSDRDIEERRGFGLLTEEQARNEAAERDELRRRLVAALVAGGFLGSARASEEEILDAWLAFLARSDARGVIVSLEDLWGEAASQNIPGTVDQHPNWRRRTALSLEEIASSPEVAGRLQAVGAFRACAGRDLPGVAGPRGDVAPSPIREEGHA
jgi:4-alpha-glucanotransferase